MTLTHSDGFPVVSVSTEATRSRVPALWSGLTAVIATLSGLAPHALHHVGLFAGAAFAVGAGGNLLFGALGLVMSVPLLRRLHRRYRTWKAPAVAVAIFAVMFTLSAFVIGPAITGADPSDAPARAGTETRAEHNQHHDDSQGGNRP